MKGRLRVLTINIWNRMGPWDDRLPMLQRGVAKLAPDIVGLQEIVKADGRTQADEINTGLGYESAFGNAHEIGGGVFFGNAVLSRWPIQRSTVFPLPACGTSEKRSLLFCEIASPHGVIPFFVTHLNWMFHESAVREAQVLRIADIVKEVAPTSGLPAVLVGDFNAEPDATSIRFLRGLHTLEGKSTFFADTFGQSGKGPGFTFDARNNPFAAPTNEYPRRIDYVFTRGPDKKSRGLPLTSEVVLTEAEGGVCASDHYGVLSEVSI